MRKLIRLEEAERIYDENKSKHIELSSSASISCVVIFLSLLTKTILYPVLLVAETFPVLLSSTDVGLLEQDNTNKKDKRYKNFFIRIFFVLQITSVHYNRI